MADLRGRRVVLGVTGGIAAYKAAYLARSLAGLGADVTAILTDAATSFVGPDTFAGLTGNPAYVSFWEAPGEIVHVRLAHDADVLVIAPATANTIAKLAHGLADDLLSAVAPRSGRPAAPSAASPSPGADPSGGASNAVDRKSVV